VSRSRREQTPLEIMRSPVVPTEKQVEHMGDRLMVTMGWEAVRFSQARATQQSPGIPDRKYYHRELGVTLWWEAKRPGGKQRPAQRAFQRMAEACGEVYVLGGVEELAVAARELMRLGRRRPLVFALPLAWDRRRSA
jgi:hypothetical protein